ncbi:hypothetical protein [Sphingobium sp. D43FB]|nr:hypothetical protein [Sphingobium sp. D43FB]
MAVMRDGADQRHQIGASKFRRSAESLILHAASQEGEKRSFACLPNSGM